MKNANFKLNTVWPRVVASGVRSSILAITLGISPVQAEPGGQSWQVIVNSDRDEITPDKNFTLREAISLVNQTLHLEALSPEEQAQVQVINRPESSIIKFDFQEPVKIQLTQPLPSLTSNGLVVDGTSHPNYDPDHSATAEITIPIPMVSLTPTTGASVFRGLSITGDRITIKGLSIYGFAQPHFPTDTTPGADIVVSSRLPTTTTSRPPQKAPKQVTILDNWLGLSPDETSSTITSGFGIWVFDGIDTRIEGNRIERHGGSAILTSTQVEGLKIKENLIVGNGLRGMPHAIYLEGDISESIISDNLFCGNDGSAVYLFKTQGAVKINHNTMKFNGRRIPSAAVYLMGDNHQVLNNNISSQTGTGVTIAAYPPSSHNLIEDNLFTNLAGLSIDLNTRNHTNKPFFKLGDGINPPRNSGNRRQDTANLAINAPEFMSQDFYLIDGQVHLDGVADPETQITLYQVIPNLPQPTLTPLAAQSKHYGPLSKPLAHTRTDSSGRFSFTRKDLTPGIALSAIASSTDYGTSEPARNTLIKALDNPELRPTPPQVTIPKCTTTPIAQVNPPPVQPKPLTKIKLKVPTNIHFALDKSDISPTSGQILQKITQVLTQFPFLTIELQGHTDFRASNQYNLALSKRRSLAARNYLLQQGIDPARMTILPLGESQLKKPGNTILEHAYNRRVEIIFRDLQGAEIILEEQDADLQPEN